MSRELINAAKKILEHIVYYDLVERRGQDVADGIIDELVSISRPEPEWSGPSNGKA